MFRNEDGRLIPGQFARVRMGQPKQQTLVMIDERAIGTDQDKKFVMASATTVARSIGRSRSAARLTAFAS